MSTPPMFKDFVPQRGATIITRLTNAGAVTLGKATMGEFASAYIGSRPRPEWGPQSIAGRQLVE